MRTTAVVLDRPGEIGLASIALDAADPGDLVVDVRHSGISTGTEKLLVTGRMPPFPGMGYPLVPGYESVGRVLRGAAGFSEGDAVFVPGARCFGPVRGLFGASAERLVVPASRAVRLDGDLGREGVLIALAATAHHAVHDRDRLALPDLIVGHGVLGRLIARLTVALGGAPVVHETAGARRDGAAGYAVRDPEGDEAKYDRVLDASGAAGALDRAIARLAKGGEVVLAGFYAEPVAFAFPPAFMAEARIRVAAEFTPADLDAVTGLVAAGRLSLAGLVTHHRPATAAGEAYRTAFHEPRCLKMTLDWSTT
ncbi:MAG: chlorophyll synthesis pathway protein BchC [Paracoccaceae bacterium]